MDGLNRQQQVDIEAQVRDIKARMPETYKSIQAKAGLIGRDAYGYVRKSLAGQPNLFYAVERGHVVGTPFTLTDITADVARVMVAFGVGFLVIWGQAPQAEAADGAA